MHENLAAIRVEENGEATDRRLGNPSPKGRAVLLEGRYLRVQI